MITLSIEIPKEIKEAIEILTKATYSTQTQIISKAITEYAASYGLEIKPEKEVVKQRIQTLLKGKNTRIPKLSFEKAKQIAQPLRLKSKSEWRQYVQTTNQTQLPLNPQISYIKKGWKGWEDFLGKNPRKQRIRKKYLPFEEARNYVRDLNLETVAEWTQLKTLLPKNIPQNPATVYKNTGYKNIQDWIGYKIKKHSKKCENLQN
jgi:hypothetical protein